MYLAKGLQSYERVAKELFGGRIAPDKIAKLTEEVRKKLGRDRVLTVVDFLSSEMKWTRPDLHHFVEALAEVQGPTPSSPLTPLANGQPDLLLAAFKRRFRNDAMG